jgi:hypothetical protein
MNTYKENIEMRHEIKILNQTIENNQRENESLLKKIKEIT